LRCSLLTEGFLCYFVSEGCARNLSILAGVDLPNAKKKSDTLCSVLKKVSIPNMVWTCCQDLLSRSNTKPNNLEVTKHRVMAGREICPDLQGLIYQMQKRKAINLLCFQEGFDPLLSRRLALSENEKQQSLNRNKLYMFSFTDRNPVFRIAHGSVQTRADHPPDHFICQRLCFIHRERGSACSVVLRL
jgi:hypothetical protein